MAKRTLQKKTEMEEKRESLMCLCLKTESGQNPESSTMTWEDGALLGEYMTHNIGESPNAVVESRLSAILEECPHQKYYLSPKACQGILTRATRRGKELPKPLLQALNNQIECWDDLGNGNGQSHVTEYYTEEVSQTLNCMHDPMTILDPCAYQLVGVNSNSMKSSNPNSGCYETEQAGTMTTNGCVPNNQGGTAIMEPVSNSKVYGICSYSSNCMKSSNPHSGVYEAETSRTLDTVSCGNPVCCQGGMAVVEPVIPIEGNGCRESHKGDGWSTEQVSYTLNTVERHGVAYGETDSSAESHPVVVDRAAFNQGKNAQFDIKIEETETVPSMVARGPHAVAQPVQYRVRRFTPLECTRLQGYPDGWVDIGDWIDTKGKKHKEADAPKYKALGNSIALPFWKWLCHNIVNRLKKDGQTTTMASLFDGIGGFPLCWIESTQEKSDVLWISEIEEFPIAVTRHHFS